MTHLNIQQGSNVETVSTLVIKKLYDVALTVPEPEQGEIDAAYMSGHISVPHSYREYVEYLAGKIGRGTGGVVTSIVNNPSGRFQDLTIDVVNDFYIKFEDPAVESLMISKNISSDGVGVTEADAADTNLVGVFSLNFVGNTDVTKFNEFRYFTAAKVNIPNQTFYGCSNLKEIYLGDTVTIGGSTFRESGIEDVNAPLLLSMDMSCFMASGIKTVTNLGSITSIPSMAFYRCRNLQSVILPTTVTSIGDGAFNIRFSSEISAFTTISGLDNVTSFGGECFRERSSLTIPGSALSNAITIGNYAFERVKFTGGISIPGLTSIGDGAFSNTNITSIDLSSSTITSIPSLTFSGCSNLSKIKLPTTVTYLGENWCKNMCSTIFISGLDNVNSHSTYSYNFDNITIINPIKTSLVLDESIVKFTNNNATTRIHSYYEPLRTSTKLNSLAQFGYPKNTHFVYNVFGGTGSFTIGLLYYKNITLFGDATFFRCNVENLVINNTTPPVLNNSDTSFSGEIYWQSWGNSIFGNLSSSDPLEKAFINTLWVPDSAVATYQADPQYSGLTIKGINTKTNGVDYDLPRYATFAAWEAAEETAVAQGGHAPQGLIEEYM